ncbi:MULTISPECIES: TenA family transcriptional regulator [Kordiimonas]|jgi:pyrroloquinoline quinone (PQQ) biosynthesis protein C|uniref:TenA family transcriptional regulator n=1 Tax=Kordiimonas TaxID=288021 RepID=UPI002580819A|nr:iron-containing redox enzyme family protein [Kordiimonas sp. UBA4487]
MLSDDTQSGAIAFYDRLVAETEVDRAAFMALPIIRTALKGGLSKDVYLGYLSEAFHHVKHTVPLMALVNERLDEKHTAFQIGLAEYALEKRGQERWILHDIEHAGGDADAVKNGTPANETQALVDFAYEYIRQVSPMAIFGMIFVIERTGSGLAERAVEHLMETLGLPRKCFSYLLSHGFADLSEISFFEGLMAQVNDPKEQDAIVYMAKRMYGLYGQVFQAIADKSGFSEGD